jgi:hypothetical protein
MRPINRLERSMGKVDDIIYHAWRGQFSAGEVAYPAVSASSGIERD